MNRIVSSQQNYQTCELLPKFGCFKGNHLIEEETRFACVTGRTQLSIIQGVNSAAFGLSNEQVVEQLQVEMRQLQQMNVQRSYFAPISSEVLRKVAGSGLQLTTEQFVHRSKALCGE